MGLYFKPSTTLAYVLFQRRKDAKEQHRQETQVLVQDRLVRGRTGMMRAELIARQRSNPLSAPVRVPLDEAGILELSMCYLDGDWKRPSLDSLAPGK